MVVKPRSHFLDKNRSAHARELQHRTTSVDGAFRDYAGSLPPGLYGGEIRNDSPHRVRHAVLGLDGYTHVGRDENRNVTISGRQVGIADPAAEQAGVDA